MIKMNTWITQFGVRKEKLCLRENPMPLGLPAFTYMQRNTREINANHWMEVNTSGAMDELIIWIKEPTFRMNNFQPTSYRLGRVTTIHHTMAVDPMP